MKRGQLGAMIGLLLVAALVGYLALRNRQPPVLPADADHATFVNSGRCIDCHGPDDEVPRGPKHPVGNDCMRCHGKP